ncbi:carbohydrate ABC transporter permease [Anoxybacillus sp. LAT_35]|jgi:raffinose/stachyose/melibiose transport system permease protein|uniref:carbohydrate ABC transporter permease n=2 Tax=Anoxybacillus TaxID=150247 RepID=UPI001EDC7CFA|nr:MULTISPECIES: carbohydrate ABC transporter permease [unclassified Anoxybacillus]MCG5024191.1 carbohydrate ABC transporter permease [Anoxybacillus flavithermus]MCG3086113.1 carbohydrate ABC transporter permease [Anoxybacillus sp. LAT27]MCG6172907.1 carbohydrate ABC transporter permease [Anoxybacillus sp. LAT_11]MCG6173537.1 carbohydrate ABC transporter permease [Anoxybacillus sp. LAT_11]MCG6173901.1 carbohydrate ABC transporter permease [Anoxybacillus sp. LAT_31]
MKRTIIYAKKAGMFLFYMVLFAVAGLQILPLIWLLFFSLKNNHEVFNTPLFSLPSPPRWENYVKVWVEGDIGRYFFNSLWITTVSVVFTVLLASFVTFAITRMNWKLKHVVLGLFMVGLMIPIHSTLIPLFNFFMKVKLIDHPMSIVLTNIGFNLPITIMILLGFYNALPRELEESAVMDGCSVHRMFFQVILPMTSPVIVTTTIINMIYNWNEFVFVNTFISSDEYKTLTVGIQNFIGQYTTDWGAIGATLMISVLPILILFFFLSNKIMEGITAGAIKG